MKQLANEDEIAIALTCIADELEILNRILPRIAAALEAKLPEDKDPKSE